MAGSLSIVRLRDPAHRRRDPDCCGPPDRCSNRISSLCVDCGAAVTASGIHGLSCLKSRGRFPRHENMKEIVGKALRSAGLPTRLEPLGLCRGTNNKRPDGETLVPWQSGQPLAFDVTYIDSFAPSRQHYQPGAALVTKEAEKRSSLFLRHRLSVAVTRGNCLAVLGSIPGGPVLL